MRPTIPLLMVLLAGSGPAAAQDWQDAPAEPAPEAPPADAPAEAAPPAPAEVPPPAPPPAIRVETPPPPAPVPRRGYRVHDGFYLRMSVGGGYMTSKVTYDDSTIADRTLSGGGGVLELLIGGSPARGLAIGGGLWGQNARNPETDPDEVESYESLDFGMLGVFIDGFPDPTGGFHVGGAIGVASLDGAFEDDDFDPDPERERLGEEDGGTGGIGGSAWVGYDAWISPEWSLGGMLRFSGAVTTSNADELEQRANTRAFAILFTALYH
jgi:hypothetical protein